MSERKPKLPDLNEDSSWDQEVQGVQLHFREAKLRERAQAQREAIANSPESPAIEEQARLMSLVVQRRKDDNSLEPLEYAELMERGERFFQALTQAYMLGLVALEQRTKKLSQPSRSETSVIQSSENLVRP